MVLIATLSTSCKNEKQSKDSLPCIDVGKNYPEKEIILTDIAENGHYFELDLIELKQAYKENRLSGKLKELVATLNEEEDNNVFMFVN